MSSLNVNGLEPFLYQAAPISTSPAEAAEQYYGVSEAMQGNYGALLAAPQAASSSNQINEQAIEGYLNRVIEALKADMVALEARITALEP